MRFKFDDYDDNMGFSGACGIVQDELAGLTDEQVHQVWDKAMGLESDFKYGRGSEEDALIGKALGLQCSRRLNIPFAEIEG